MEAGASSAIQPTVQSLAEWVQTYTAEKRRAPADATQLLNFVRNRGGELTFGQARQAVKASSPRPDALQVASASLPEIGKGKIRNGVKHFLSAGETEIAKTADADGTIRVIFKEGADIEVPRILSNTVADVRKKVLERSEQNDCVLELVLDGQILEDAHMVSNLPRELCAVWREPIFGPGSRCVIELNGMTITATWYYDSDIEWNYACFRVEAGEKCAQYVHIFSRGGFGHGDSSTSCFSLSRPDTNTVLKEEANAQISEFFAPLDTAALIQQLDRQMEIAQKQFDDTDAWNTFKKLWLQYM